MSNIHKNDILIKGQNPKRNSGTNSRDGPKKHYQLV